MVIGERFAWAHLQKTGGSATFAMFRLFPELIVFADPAEDRDKHSSFGAREDLIAGKVQGLQPAAAARLSPELGRVAGTPGERGRQEDDGITAGDRGASREPIAGLRT